MVLSNDLISQFVKATKDDKQTKTEKTVYGTVVESNIESNGKRYARVRFDGAAENQLTPAIMEVDVENGERVSILIKDHSAIVTGNLSKPAAKLETVEIVTENVEAQNAKISKIEADNVTINETLTAHKASMQEIEAENVKISEELTAASAKIKELDTEKLSVEQADVKYANIDFANIGVAAIEKLFTESGIIADLVMSEGHVTGKLVGVTIIGDLIEGGTVKADKLVILGTDGLYYKLNTNGVQTTAEQTEYNSLNGKIITAKSITAEKVNVDDLVAFGATIGGFHITEDSIYSGAKASVDNTTRGIYQDIDGQFAIGDANNFLKFYKDTDGTYKLAISASTITFGDSGKSIEEAIEEVETATREAVNEIQVGGRNLILSSNDISNYWIGSQAIISQDGDVIKGLTNTTSTQSWPRIWNTSVSRLTFDTTSKYTLSFDIRVDSDRGVSIGITEPGGREAIDITTVLATTEWTKITHIFTPSRETSQYAYNLQFYTYHSGEANTTAWIEIKNVKLEKGNKATDWTPAPEDIDTAIEGIKAVTITGVDVLYALSTSSTTAPASGWSTTAPTWVSGKYMWQKTVTTYGDGTSSESAVTCISGATGQNGTNGIGIDSITNYYLAAASSSGVTTDTGGWTETVQSITISNKYLWNYEKITYTNGTTKLTDPCIIGVYGDTGASGTDGKGISSITECYAVSTSNSVAPTTWHSTIPTLTSTNKYLWNYEIISYTDNSTPYTGTPRVIGVYGDTGSTGNGISSITEQFYLSTSKTSQIGGSWLTTAPTWSTGKYIWTRSVIVYTNGTTVYTDPVCDSSWEAVNEVKVGGTNMLQYTDTSKYGTEYWSAWGSAAIEITSDYYVKVTNVNAAATFGAYGSTKSANVINGREYTISFDGYADSEINLSYCYLMGTDGNLSLYGLGISPTLSTESKKISFTFTATSDKTCSVMLATASAADYTGSFYFKNLKLEEGNKATSWAPATEDIQTDIDNALDNALVAVDDNATKIEYLDGLVEKINGALNTLVTDDNGTTLLQQTGTGWSFNFSDIRNALDKYDSYITLDESSDQPCIILGKTTSNFKVKITNTDIEFIDGSGNPVAKITSNDDTGESLIEIEKAKINGDLQQDNWVWQTRSNGNYGLIWKG